MYLEEIKYKYDQLNHTEPLCILVLLIFHLPRFQDLLPKIINKSTFELTWLVRASNFTMALGILMTYRW